jgi:replicative DNA helicase
MTGGWQNTDLIILAARPSMGKTAVLISAALAASGDNTDVAIFSLEMEDVRLVDRMLVGIADIDMDRFKDGNLTDDEVKRLEEAADLIHKRNIYIDDKSNPTPQYIKNRARILKKKSDALGRKFLILTDYLQLMDSEASTNRNREQEVATISKQSKQTAKDLKCPYILLAQLSRSCESRNDKRPILSDLRESGAIEQDADLVIFIYRDWYYGIKEDEEGNSTKFKGELNIAKQRNGSIGPVFFGHNTSLTRIFDYGQIPNETIKYVESWIQKHENSKDDGPF